MQTSLTLLAGVENRRLGRVLGDDGLARVVRSFHFRVRSVKCGGRGTARTRIAYVRREGKHAKSSADVENAAGDKDALIDAADRIEATSRIKRGPTAERILQSFVLELPAESTAAERAATAEAVVEHWRTRYGEDRPGHEAIAVVHMHGDEAAQPHLHVEVAARPILADETVDRSVRLWTDPSPSEAVKAERAAMAEIVNTWCTTKAAFHAGAFKEIGREDEGKPRLPISAWRAMRKAMRAAGDKDEAARIEAAAYAVEANRRAGLRKAGLARAAEIDALKAAGEWPPKSQRAALQTELATAKKERDGWEKNTVEIVELAYEQAGRDLPDLGTKAGRDAAAEFLEAGAGRAEAAADARAEEREEAGRTLTAAKNETATLTDEKQQAETRADTAEGRVRELEALNKTQTEYVTDWHGDRGAELPDLATVEGQSAAWANMRAWQAGEKKRRKDEAAAKEAAEQALADERRQADKRIAEAVRSARQDERDSTQAKIDAAVRLALEGERQEQNRDGRGTGEAGGDDRRPDQGADRPGTEARRGGGAEDHGAGRAERPRAGGDRPEGDDGSEQTGGVGQPASAGGPHAVDGNVGGEAWREGVESHVVAAPGREDAEGLAREHGPVEEPGVVETPADRRGGGDGADVGGDGDGDWNWLLEMGGTAHAPEPGRPVVAAPPSDVVVSGGGEEQQKAPEPPPPAPKPKPAARPWKDLSDDELVNHWGGASRRRRAATTDENKDGARRKIDELHAEAKHRNTTLKALDARKQRRDDRGR